MISLQELARYLPFPAIGATIVVNLYRNKTWSPRQVRRYDRKTFWINVLPCIALSWNSFASNSMETWLFVGGTIALIAFVYLVVQNKPFTDEECLRNYSCDPTCCGRCEYNLTGNVSGICPECGWQIPARIFPLTADQAMSTTSRPNWRIKPLRHWRWTLLAMVGAAVVFGGMTVEMVLLRSVIGTAVTAVLFLYSVINIYRVIAYGRRQVRP